MDKVVERFFICSQWSGYWNDRLLTFVNKMNSNENKNLSPVDSVC